MVAHAVAFEPVSAQESLRTEKITGKIDILGHFGRRLAEIRPVYQKDKAIFPVGKNREDIFKNRDFWLGNEAMQADTPS